MLEGWPPGLEVCTARELHERLGGSTLIRLPGRAEPALFVSVLLHGNETSGWDAVRRLLKRHPGGELPRSLLLFIGNVAAAARGVRSLPIQQDYNRIWHGAAGPEGELAKAVKTALTSEDLFAAVDLHNNTGHNPHYSVVTDLSTGNLALAWLFDDQAVYVREPDTVLARLFAGRCPAVTLELGPIGDPRCADRALDFLSRLMALETLPPADLHGLRTYRTEARVHIPPGVDFSFVGEERATPLVLTGGVEGVNFHELPAGTDFAATALPLIESLTVLDSDRRNVTEEYFAVDGQRLRLRRPVVPAMYTLDPAVIRQDCLCYFMQRMSLAHLPG